MTLPIIDKDLLKIYPSSDGKRMAENTRQFEWIVLVKLGLEKTTAGLNIFVAGDLLWYPVKGFPSIRVAPDVMVSIGRPKGHRSSYLQWLEDDVVPQVAIEILSPGNRPKEMKKKLKFYEKYGIQEYYIYNPDNNRLEVYIRDKGKLNKIHGLIDWISPLLKIRWYLTPDTLELYHPNGEPFLSYLELVQLNEWAVKDMEKQKQLLLAEKGRVKIVREELSITKEELGTTKEELGTAKEELGTAKEELDTAKEENALLKEKLRNFGLDL